MMKQLDKYQVVQLVNTYFCNGDEIFMKLAEWNIHKMTNDISVKQFVIDKLIDVDADIICLVEYVSDKGIEENLEEKYFFEESNTISGNKVFIAVKKELVLDRNRDRIEVKNKNEVEGCYNFLHIEFLMQNGEPLSVIGVRMLSPIDASKQTLSLQEYLSKLSKPSTPPTSFLCTGDFNIQGYQMAKWFPNISTEEMINTDCELSKSSIIYTNRYNCKVIGFGAVDHVLHSNNINVKSEYDWKFLSCDSIYPCFNEIDIGTTWNIPPAYPDHALMISNIDIN